MRGFGKSSLGLTGAILIAHPDLLDPNFRRTVLYLGLHDQEEGAFGLILNRPLKKKVSDFLALGALGELSEAPVYFGGPVGGDQLSFAYLGWDHQKDVFECRFQLDLDEARNAIEEDPNSVRAFLGYSGWSAGQLENELIHQSWIVQPPGEELLDPDQCNSSWHAIVRSLGPWFQLLAEVPDDPTLN